MMSIEQIDHLIQLGVKIFKIQGRDYIFDGIYDDLCTYFFNNKYSKEELRHKIDLISAKILQNKYNIQWFYL